ncbi:MAG: hypothetical protein HZC54_15205 [Verrucomicrobia bacterium]|nr:hypothetical protein [Verrucomicrobiota bacterium]
MKTISRNLLLLAMAVLLSAAACQKKPMDAASLQMTVDGFRKLISPFQSCLEHVHGKGWKENATPELRKTFSAGAYFTVLHHLSMESGWTLDYVYQTDNVGGRPVLYARRADAEPFKSFDDFRAAKQIATIQPTDIPWGNEFYNGTIRLDGSPASYFEYVVLTIMGDQLFHIWHDNYHDELVICDKSGLDAFFAEWDSTTPFDRSVPPALRKGAYALDLQPRVRFEADNVAVSVAVFSKWGGFERRSWTITKRAPYKVLNMSKETLLDYYCGIVI